MRQTLFIYLKHHKVINSFQKKNMYSKMKRRNLSRGEIFFILSLGDFDKTSPDLLKNLLKINCQTLWVIVQLLYF